MSAILHDLLFDYTLRTVALGSAALGLVAGALGTFAVLRRQSLLGDAVSHAALPGIVLAFMLTGTKASLVLVAGAGVLGWLASLLILFMVRTTRIKTDTALGLVLSVFFGLGMLLMSVVQRSAGAGQAGLEKFLFGQAAALIGRDLLTITVLGAVALVLVTVFWKEFKLLVFDGAFGGALGFPIHLLDVMLTTLLVVAIVIGLQTVGVVLMSALIVAPAVAARQWTDRLGHLVVLAGFFGAMSGLVGAAVSSTVPKVPTGPTIILVITVITVLSLLLAPRRGLLPDRWRRLRQRRQIEIDQVLADLYRLATQHDDPEAVSHEVGVLQTMSPTPGVSRSLQILAESGLVQEVSAGRWKLTPAGVESGEALVLGGAEQGDGS